MQAVPLRLHDVADVEDFVSAGVRKQVREWRSQLGIEDVEDLVQSVVLEVWRAAERFNPRQGGSFAQYCRGIVPRAAASWYRQRFIDTRNQSRYSAEDWQRIIGLRQEIDLRRLDAPAATGHDALLRDVLPGDASDDPASRLADVAWLFDPRDRDLARLQGILRDEARREGAIRNH